MTQSVGKIPINLNRLKVDFMSFSAHKIYGPKKIGVLYVKNKFKNCLQPQMYGSKHEFGIQFETIPVHQIVSMGKLCNILKKEMLIEIKKLRNYAMFF